MKAVSVLGEVEADRLGVVLPHEHLHTTSTFLCTAGCDRDRTMAEIDPAALRQSPMRFAANLDMRDEEIAGSELGKFREAGGATLVRKIDRSGTVPLANVPRAGIVRIVAWDAAGNRSIPVSRR